jgi:uncharacterized protein YndB with AHSA1/START domain
MNILVERTIHADPAQVARIMFDPEKEPGWIGGAHVVERLTLGPTAVGARVRREGGLLGPKQSWVTEVTAYEPERRLDMAIVQGPAHGELSYEVRPTAGGAIVAVHNRVDAGLPIPGRSWRLKKAVSEDLKRLAALMTHSQG